MPNSILYDVILKLDLRQAVPAEKGGGANAPPDFAMYRSESCSFKGVRKQPPPPQDFQTFRRHGLVQYWPQKQTKFCVISSYLFLVMVMRYEPTFRISFL